jgi:hypothetical protein
MLDWRQLAIPSDRMKCANAKVEIINTWEVRHEKNVGYTIGNGSIKRED